ncbi:hypothetical protein Taro_030142 [Colocasia esculenta]|uniref:Uncharacterized protein n=1 Tax=Colocasia esculenta TaxID=4460 RepID=A0A843VLP3_COLES|nr:hypothetical protein [Colocasia esculenta]
MYMDVDDRVFVPSSDVYMNLNTRLDECRFMTPEDLNMRLNVCRFMGGHTGGVPSPAEVSRARASRASASAEAEREPARVLETGQTGGGGAASQGA